MTFPAWLPAVGSALDAIGGFVGASKANKLAKKQFQFQVDMAHNQIAWRVADAMRAGIHPLYALGPTGMTFSPVSGGGDFGGGFGQMGQDLSRAAMSMMTDRERRVAAAAALMREDIVQQQEDEKHEINVERGHLENLILRSQIARLNSGQVGPVAPEGITTVPPGTVRSVPSTVGVGAQGEPARAPGALTDYQYHRREDGGIGIVQSEQMKERTEDDVFQQAGWLFRNNLLPFFRGVRPPPVSAYPLPNGFDSWIWDPYRQAFYPSRRGDRLWQQRERRRRRGVE